ncbi:hypothetical protein ACJ41O_005537 [Fusarium nematophilum]
MGNAMATAELLLNSDMDPDQPDTRGNTPVSYAAHHGFTDLVELLLRHNSNIEKGNRRGLRPLHAAARQNNEQTIVFLVENGADIEARQSEGMTPLLTAAAGGKWEAVRCLADQGADVMATSDSKSNALHLACLTDNKFLLRFFAGKGVEMEAKTTGGLTVLMRAVAYGKHENATWLIQHGANVNAVGDQGWRPLHYAAYYGHESVVELLLDNAADPVAETADGRRAHHLSRDTQQTAVTKLLNERTPVTQRVTEQSVIQSVSVLVFAAGRGNVDQVIQLIDKGVDIDAMDLNGRRAISLAAENGQVDIVQLLIQRNANVDLVDVNGESAIWWASRNGHKEVVRQLLNQRAFLEMPDAEGQSPLSAASQQGHVVVVKLLLRRGGNPNSQTVYGTTPLMFASAFGHPRTAEALLEFGADPDYEASNGETALSWAESKGHQELVELIRRCDPSAIETTKKDEYANDLLQAAGSGRVAEIERLINVGVDPRGVNKGEVPIFWAASGGQTDSIDALVSHGADLNYRNSADETIMGVAAYWGFADVIKLLHQHGARVEDTDNNGRTPLMDAAGRGHKEAIEVLLELGARTETKDNDRRTALWFAARLGQKATVELLLAQGATMESADSYGYTPLLAAVNNGKRDVARLLLEKGAQMRPDSQRNLSPLIHAAYNGDEAMANLLIDHGADLNYIADEKLTAIHYAAMYGHIMAAKILIEAGAELDLKDDDGRTPLSYAKENSYERIVQLFSQAGTLRQQDERAKRRVEQDGLNRRSSYRYRPFAREGCIRVLVLHPGKADDILHFDLIEVELKGKPSFEALSYEWRDKIGTVPVQCGTERVFITPNCKAAMASLRLESEQRHLWIDAVCINQEDNHERTKQVAMMTKIYRSAKAVIMWLGEESDSTSAAFENLQVMVQVYQMLQTDEEKSPLDHSSFNERQDAFKVAESVMQDKKVLGGFTDLYWRQYFTRAWIFQEIILAGSRGIVMCGKHHCPWKTLKCALVAFRAYSSSNNPAFYHIVKVDHELSHQGKVWLGSAAVAISVLEATDPRDKIFATLGLGQGPDKSVKRPVADYTLTVQEVFVHATRYFIDLHQDLSVWRGRNRHSTKSISQLPSWVPEFKTRWDDLYENPFSEPPPTFSELIQPQPSSTMTSLYASGCIIDKVVFKWTITQGQDALGVVLPVLHALARQDRSIYDTYPGSEEYRIEIQQLPDSLRPDGSGDAQHRATREQRKHCEGGPINSNGRALLTTILDMQDASEEEYLRMSTFLVWAISTAAAVPLQSKFVPDYLRGEFSAWAVQSRARKDFDLEVCKDLEDRLRYDRDLVYTENGLFGLTNGGEAEKGMLVAVLGGASDLCLLRKMDEPESHYEYVDTVFMRYIMGKIEKLEQICKEPKIERLEIR